MKPEQLERFKKRLPEIPGLNGREEYLNSAVLVLLVLLDGEYHLVFQKRCSQVRQGGEVSFPGGQIEPGIDQSPEQTAIRETMEEMGIPEDKLTILGRLDTLVAPVGAIIEPYVGIAAIASLDEIKIDPNEVEYVFAIPVSFFVENKPLEYQVPVRFHPITTDAQGRKIMAFPATELGLPEKCTRPWGWHKYKLYVYNYENEIIWGITARFIYDLVNLLKSS